MPTQYFIHNRSKRNYVAFNGFLDTKKLQDKGYGSSNSLTILVDRTVELFRYLIVCVTNVT